MPDLPPSSFIHAHCDGGARGNPGPAGFGAVITDPHGQTLAELSEFLGNRTNNYAEYSGLLAVLAWALENHHPRLKVVSDSELMVRQIQGRYKVNSPDLKPLWQEARNRIARLEAFEIAHALRHKNKAADALANAAMDRGTNKSPHPKALDVTPKSPVTPPKPPVTPTRIPVTPPKLSGAPSQALSPPEVGKPPSRTAAPTPTMLRGFTKEGKIHLLGSTTLPDGIFVKVIPE